MFDIYQAVTWTGCRLGLLSIVMNDGASFKLYFKLQRGLICGMISLFGLLCIVSNIQNIHMPYTVCLHALHKVFIPYLVSDMVIEVFSLWKFDTPLRIELFIHHCVVIIVIWMLGAKPDHIIVQYAAIMLSGEMITVWSAFHIFFIRYKYLLAAKMCRILRLLTFTFLRTPLWFILMQTAFRVKAPTSSIVLIQSLTLLDGFWIKSALIGI